LCESRAAPVAEWIEDLPAATLDGFAPSDSHPEDWDLVALGETLFRQFDVRIAAARYEEIGTRAELDELVGEAVRARYAERERELGADLLRALEGPAMVL